MPSDTNRLHFARGILRAEPALGLERPSVNFLVEFRGCWFEAMRGQTGVAISFLLRRFAVQVALHQEAVLAKEVAFRSCESHLACAAGGYPPSALAASPGLASAPMSGVACWGRALLALEILLLACTTAGVQDASEDGEAVAAARALPSQPFSRSPPVLPVGDTCSRKYEGIGGLLNSDAPWLRGFPEPQRSDILDVLFKPRWAASLQVLKLEIGGESPLMESRIQNADCESCSDSSAVGSKFV